MTAQANAVEKSLTQLCAQWNQAVEVTHVRVIVWNVSASAAERLLHTFFESQQHAGSEPLDYHAPDLFISLTAEFETGFRYSRSLCESLIGSYRASRKSFAEQDIAHDWAFTQVPHPDSAAGFIALLNSFALHHREQFRNVAVVLAPSTTTSADAFDRWLRAAIAAGLAPNVRLVLIGTTTQPRWAWLEETYPDSVCVIESSIDMTALARETAAQSPGAGPAAAYRQMLADVFSLVEKGTARQTSDRAQAALKIANHENWYDQQVVLHMAVAGAHQKEKDHAAAIEAYRHARECAVAACASDPGLGGTLVMQTWFGEAGVWLMEEALPVAAKSYMSAAEAAQSIMHRFFALEGFRMAAWCHAKAGDQDQARNCGALAAREGKLMASSEREASTLPLALNDLLQLQDAKRTAELKRIAEEFQERIKAAHLRAEADAAALGTAPDRSRIDAIENTMDRSFEHAFQQFRNEREQVIARGDAYFRKVIAVGRDLLHPQWSGLPDVRHPLDQEQSTWEAMPMSAELPPAGDLMPAALGAAAIA